MGRIEETILIIPLSINCANKKKQLKGLVFKTVANHVVVGLMALTLIR
jgi:hypothetical protein